MTYENSISNISIGIAERLLNLFITGSFYALYEFVYERFALFSIPNHPITWILLLLITDFIWYWYHRLGHEVNIMWGAHVVHHQSEEFNYTVSARITTLQAIIRNLFWCTLPFLGFEPPLVMTILVIHGTYSFFTHTETIRKLGWLEKILITPSHHRVHHASNPKYLNKNYGDIFIFWDKIFGTFEEEKEKPVYGLTHPLKSHSFLWQHLHYYAELWEACKQQRGIFRKLKVLFGRPEDLSENIRKNLEERFLTSGRRKNHSQKFRFYLALQILLSAITLFVFTIYFSNFDFFEKLFIATIILMTLINCGALLEQQRWIFYLETARAALLGCLLSYEMESISLFLVVVLISGLISCSQTTARMYYEYFLGEV